MKDIKTKSLSILFSITLLVFSIFFTGCENLYNLKEQIDPEKTEQNDATIYEINIIEAYALWPGEKGLSITVSDLSENTGNISSIKWDMDLTDGLDFDVPDATGLAPDFAYEKGSYYTVTIEAASDNGIFYYRVNVPVASVFDLGMPEGGSFCTLNFLDDGRMIVLQGSTIMIQKAVGSDSFTKYFDFPACDPAFVLVKSDNDTILVGAGQYSNGSIWEVKLSDYSGTAIEIAENEAKIQNTHFSGDLLDDQTLIIDAGESNNGSWIGVIDISSTQWVYKVILRREKNPSTGIWIDSEKNLFIGSCSTSFGTMGGSIFKFRGDLIQSAISNAIPIDEMNESSSYPLSLSDGTMIMDNSTYSQYSFMDDGLGNMFVSGNWYGVGPGYFKLDTPYSSEGLPLVFHASTEPSDPGYKGITSLGTYGGGYLGWCTTEDWVEYKAIVVPVKPVQ